MSNHNCAWIAGASGLVGNHLLLLLLDDPRVRTVLSFGRRELEISHPKLNQRVVDFASLPQDLPDPTVAFCCLGTTIRSAGSPEAFRLVDHDYVVAFSQAASSAGASMALMISAIGADCESSNLYLRTKGEAEHAVSMLPFTTVHIARPSLLLGKRRDFRLGERLVIPLFYALWPVMLGPLKKYRAIHAQRVAKAMQKLVFHDAQGVHVHESHELSEIAVTSCPS